MLSAGRERLHSNAGWAELSSDEYICHIRREFWVFTFASSLSPLSLWINREKTPQLHRVATHRVKKWLVFVFCIRTSTGRAARRSFWASCFLFLKRRMWNSCYLFLLLSLASCRHRWAHHYQQARELVGGVMMLDCGPNFMLWLQEDHRTIQ